MSIQMKACRGLGLGLLLGAATFPAGAGTTSCDVDVYTAYTKAAANNWQFSCHNAIFAPNQSLRTITCVGNSPPPSVAYTVNASFFVRPYVPGNALSNGWKISRFDVSGARWQQNPADAFARVGFVSQAKAGAADFKVHLKSLTLEKSNGDCSRVYQEAFE